MGRKQDTGHFDHRVSGRVEYLTPKWITDLLGPFDLDPCASDPRPWDISKVNYTEVDDGLAKPWKGLVWMNPPYGRSNGLNRFVAKLSQHPGGGICLINSNTQTHVWQEIIFPTASAFFFLAGRISFCNTDGSTTKGTFGSPVFIAFGEKAAKRLQRLVGKGYYLENKNGLVVRK